MIRTYFKIAFRNLFKNKLYSSINLVGLSIGLAAALMMVMYIAKEYSFDKFNKNFDNIVKAELKNSPLSPMSYRFAESLKSAAPEIIDFARIHEASVNSVLLESDPGHKFFEPNVVFGDSGVFRVFTFEFIAGDASKALDRPGTIILTEKMAKKYFGSQNPLGKVLVYDNKHRLEVTGIIKNIPNNSSVSFDFIADINTIRSIEADFFNSIMPKDIAQKEMEGIGATGAYQTYFLLHPDASIREVEKKIPAILTTGIPESSKAFPYYLMPLNQIHFKLVAPGSFRNVKIFTLITTLILLLAIINYVNLSTAQISQRFKEISMRKISGASRRELIVQFYIESFVNVTLAFLAGAVVFSILNYVIDKQLHLELQDSLILDRFFVLPVLAIFILTVAFSGGYPALLMSKYDPLKSLKGSTGKHSSVLLIRKALTTFQFTVSISLIITFFVIHSQVNLMLNKDIGLDRTGVMLIKLDRNDGLNQHYNSIKSEIRKLNGVDQVGGSTLPIYSRYFSLIDIKLLSDTLKSSKATKLFRVDEGFLKALGLRWTLKPANNDGIIENRVIINETTAKLLHINATNYDQFVNIGFGSPVKIMGVVKDFNFTSLSEKISPMIMFIESPHIFQEYLYVKLSGNASLQETVSKIESIYNNYKTNSQFEYSFLDSQYRELYKGEIEVRKIVGLFMNLALVIAVMGLVGLTAFVLAQRTKEIGVRKVLGASVWNIIMLFSRNFINLILLAGLISSPIVYFIMNRWLNNYAYRIDLEWWFFALSCAIIMIISVVTVSLQVTKVSLVKPVKSLRSE